MDDYEDDYYEDEDGDWYYGEEEQGDWYYGEEEQGDCDVLAEVKTLSQAEQSLKELAKSWSKLLRNSNPETYVGLTYGCVYNKNGAVVSHGLPGGCHAYVNQAFRREEDENVAFILSAYCGPTFVKYSDLSEEVQRRWVGWFVSDDNPLSKHILNRDVDFVYNNGLIVEGKAGWTKSLWLCKAFRQSVETPELVRTWARLVDNGIDPLFAMYTAHMFPTVFNLKYLRFHPGEHRSVFNPELDVSALFSRKLNKVPHVGRTAEVFLKGGTAFFNERDEDKKSKTHVFGAVSRTRKVDNGWGGETKFVGDTFENILKEATRIQAEFQSKATKKKAA